MAQPVATLFGQRWCRRGVRPWHPAKLAQLIGGAAVRLALPGAVITIPGHGAIDCKPAAALDKAQPYDAAPGSGFAHSAVITFHRGGTAMAVTDLNERATTLSNEPWQHSEGAVARGIEQQTAKLPSDTFLWIAVAAMTGSAMLQMSGRKHESLFVGQWVPTFLLFGIYNKLVKIAGSDRVHA